MTRMTEAEAWAELAEHMEASGEIPTWGPHPDGWLGGGLCAAILEMWGLDLISAETADRMMFQLQAERSLRSFERWISTEFEKEGWLLWPKHEVAGRIAFARRMVNEATGEGFVPLCGHVLLDDAVTLTVSRDECRGPYTAKDFERWLSTAFEHVRS